MSLPDHLVYSDTEDENFEVTSESLQKRAKHLKNILNHFWKQWSKEYLLELREGHCQQRASGASPAIQPGDIVVVHEQDAPRRFWKLA